MPIKSAYKFRIYPTPEQQRLIAQTNGCCRFIWNWALALKNENFNNEKPKPQEERKLISWGDISAQLPQLKEQNPWLKEVNSQAIVAELQHLREAFSRFFANCKKGIKGKKGHPRFKKRHDKQSFSNQNSKSSAITQKCQECQKREKAKPDCQQCERSLIGRRQNRVENLGDGWGFLTIPKIKDIPICLHRSIEGEIGTVTITTTPTGKYFAAICVTKPGDNPVKAPIIPEKTLGIDIGIKSYIVGDDGTVIENRKHHLAELEKIQFLNRKLQKKRNRLFANCPCGYINCGLNQRATHWVCPECGGERTLRDIYHSKRYIKLRRRLAYVHELIADRRNDFIHKTTHQLTTCDKYDTIATQSTNVRGMLRNRRLARSIGDIGWYETERQLNYKCEREGKNKISAGQFEPTSKKCWATLPNGETCGYVKEDMDLATREWDCPKCGSHHDRDINGAKGAKICALRKVGFEAT